MGTYAITGAASGMGRAAAVRLRDHGHTVIGVDLKDADVVADLSTPQGRAQAADGVVAASGGRLDGAVLAAGLGQARGGTGCDGSRRSITWAWSSCCTRGGRHWPPPNVRRWSLSEATRRRRFQRFPGEPCEHCWRMTPLGRCGQ
ncbi:3-alpha-hydroxysteroid dehydrogenase [Mycobacterium kansasii]|uniref:3-alpha-hydroxysteroid dehydrogenase n=1 Tax=Mycobacterium kansasii TaxID=1768 RepID=A0A1V3WX41_MYCKA|nr:3-alpha-hydroxysteroid dehydrogenase [Mycobacterium kansasii]